jgi:hypothetical protein
MTTLQVERGKQLFSKIVAESQEDGPAKLAEKLISMFVYLAAQSPQIVSYNVADILLSDQEKIPLQEAPSTGLPNAEWEHELSSIFVRYAKEQYGTRASTVILVDKASSLLMDQFILLISDVVFSAFTRIMWCTFTSELSWIQSLKNGSCCLIASRFPLDLLWIFASNMYLCIIVSRCEISEMKLKLRLL